MSDLQLFLTNHEYAFSQIKFSVKLYKVYIVMTIKLINIEIPCQEIKGYFSSMQVNLPYSYYNHLFSLFLPLTGDESQRLHSHNIGKMRHLS